LSDAPIYGALVGRKDQVLAELNGILRGARARGVRVMPAIQTGRDLVDRFRFLVQLVDELEVERSRQAAEIEALKAALATTQRAYLQARLKPPSGPSVEATWPR
jgi:hypothetical protein